MCELNYKGTKIEIGVKLGDQNCNFTYKKWNLYRKPLRRWHVALTRGSQRLRLTINVQIRLLGPILQGFIKLVDQICKLNYRETKSEIENKLRDPKCNFTFNLSTSTFREVFFYLTFSKVEVHKMILTYKINLIICFFFSFFLSTY